jgi:aldose 1-epimerase
MYDLNISEFGDFRKYELKNSITGNGFAIVPQYGGCMVGLYFNNNNVLDAYDTYEALIENKWSKNVLLFPFPNRLKDGAYHWEGKTYHFNINNAATGNAIHGFGKNVAMRVTEVLMDKSASLTCTYTYDGTHDGYPFPFDFSVTYEMDDTDGLEVTMEVANLHATKIPWGMGWHPYFKIAESVNDLTLQMPECAMIEIDDRMLPTGNKTDYTAFAKQNKINDTNLDNGFYLTDQKSKAEVIIENKGLYLNYWQETGDKKWNFLQVFTPPHRQSIALEPMTCNIDAFNNHEGLIVLEPGESVSARFGVNVGI